MLCKELHTLDQGLEELKEGQVGAGVGPAMSLGEQQTRNNVHVNSNSTWVPYRPSWGKKRK